MHVHRVNSRCQKLVKISLSKCCGTEFWSRHDKAYGDKGHCLGQSALQSQVALGGMNCAAYQLLITACMGAVDRCLVPDVVFRVVVRVMIARRAAKVAFKRLQPKQTAYTQLYTCLAPLNTH